MQTLVERYTQCKECGNSFSSRYCSRHQCTRALEKHDTNSMINDIEWNEIDLEQGENNTSVKIDINHQNEANGDQGEINDKGEDGEDELYDRKSVLKYFGEVSFFDEEIQPENQDDNKEIKLGR